MNAPKGRPKAVGTTRQNVPNAGTAWLLQLQRDLVALERRAFAEIQFVQRLVVDGQGPDFIRGGGGEVLLQLQHVEAGAFAVLVFLLLGDESRLGVNAGG